MHIRLILIIRHNTFFLDKKINKKAIIQNSLIDLFNFKVLEWAYQYGDRNIDLIITSHNFFAYTIKTETKISVETKILDQIVRALNTNLHRKHSAHLITGIDFIRKYNDNYHCFNSYFNPYSGIDSLVAYFAFNHEEFALQNYIWESWYASQQCDKEAFLSQNNKRVCSIKTKKFCLLSCGDLFGYCHCNGGMLPEANVYVNVAHNDYKLKYIYGNDNVKKF